MPLGLPALLPSPPPAAAAAATVRSPASMRPAALPAPRWHQVGKYQEQPQLLDPLLEGVVQPLTALLRAAAAEPAAADLGAVRGVSRMLWQLSMVRCGAT